MVGSQNENEYTSVGKPVRSTYVKIIKPDGGIAAPMEEGEICIKGPQVTLKFKYPTYGKLFQYKVFSIGMQHTQYIRE